MIKKETAKKMALNNGISEETFEQAWTSEEEVDLEIPEVVVFTPTELQDRDEKLIAPIKTKHYEEGKVNGVEMDVKRVRDAEGLEFEGKTLDNLVTALKKKVLADAKIEPDEKVQNLEKEKSMLQKTIDQLREEHSKEVLTLNGKITDYNLNSSIEAAIPDKLPKGLTKADVRMMIRAGHEFDVEDGLVVAKQNGEVMKDEKQNPLPVETIVSDFYKAKGWDDADEPPPGGRRKGNEFGAGSGMVTEFKRIQNMDDLDAFCKKHDLQPQSDEILSMMDKHMTPEQRNKALRE